MDGILLVDKPIGWTSHDVVAKVRGIYQTKRVGHLGTLDPGAGGLLVLCINSATKLVPFFENDDKEYLARVLIGVKTNTSDLDGVVIEEASVPKLTTEAIDYVLQSFKGRQRQKPPIYSAIKIRGKKLYQYARKNEAVEIPLREITIFEIQRTTPIDYQDNKVSFKIQTQTSKGTYIRRLCEDIGQKLGYPSTMASLIRLKSGPFALANAYTMKQIEDGEAKIIPMLDALKHFKIIKIDEALSKLIKNGMPIERNKLSIEDEQIVFSYQNKLLAIYSLDDKKIYYRPDRIWLEKENGCE